MKPQPPDAEIVQILMLDFFGVVTLTEAEQLRHVLTRDFAKVSEAQTALRRRLHSLRATKKL